MKVKVVDLADSTKTKAFEVTASHGSDIAVVNTGATSVRIGGSDLTGSVAGYPLAPGEQVDAAVPYGDVTYAIGPGQLTFLYT